jgi:uncharacterized protein YndB with AHSA1/START domain
MPVTSITKDPDALTMTCVADFDATLERVWDAYLDPRQIERFWGPPTWPATFLRHDAHPGGRSLFEMRGPEGEVSSGYWEWIKVSPPTGDSASFEVTDGFANPDGSPNEEMPSMRMTFAFEVTAEGTRLTTTSHFTSVEQLQQLLEMGAEEGTLQAMGQIDEVLANLASFAHGRGTETRILSDTQVRITRVIRGSVDQTWRAHNEAELLKRWLLGPDGWEMPVCEVATEVGDAYRYEWAPTEGTEGEPFGFTGELLESDPPNRAVTTEQLIGSDAPGTTNELTLTQLAEGTLISVVITYPSAEIRDTVLATGMVDGMEASYARMEELGVAA